MRSVSSVSDPSKLSGTWSDPEPEVSVLLPSEANWNLEATSVDGCLESISAWSDAASLDAARFLHTEMLKIACKKTIAAFFIIIWTVSQSDTG
jgi:hypothetical protein